MKKNIFAINLGGFLAQSLHAQTGKHVVLISIDGLRPEFYQEDKWATPVLKQMAADGVSSDGVRGVFPSVTYPSHTTLIKK